MSRQCTWYSLMAPAAYGKATIHVLLEQLSPIDRLLQRATCLKTKARLHQVQIIEDVEVLCGRAPFHVMDASRFSACPALSAS